MSQHRHRLQFIHPRRFDELSKEQSSGVVSAFSRGAFKAALLSLLPVFLIVGTLDYLANGWNGFSEELLAHWQVTAVPLGVFALIGGIVGVVRR